MSSIECIGSVIVTTPTTTVVFSSIPSTYQDLMLVSTTSNDQLRNTLVQFNDNAGSAYSTNWISGHSTSSVSVSRGSSGTSITGPMVNSGMSTSPAVVTWHFLSYSNTGMNKTVLALGGEASKEIGLHTGLWRSSSAISKITLLLSGTGNYATGNTFTLWGVK